MIAFQNYAKINFKRFYKNLSYLFCHNFFAIFSEAFFQNIQETIFATFDKTSKKETSTVALQNYTKLTFKMIFKMIHTYFSRIILQHFSNRLYPNIK